MSSSVVEQIKDKLDIVTVLSSYIKMEKAGANFKARCPFHAEKTPSFFISPSRGSFYCFGCNAKGDIFSFVEKFEGLDFKGSLKVLADRAGVEIKPERPEIKNERDRMYSILEEACCFFEENLKKAEEPKKYLERRGLSSKTISTWRIGWAPLEWRMLRTFLFERGYTDKEMELAGLTKPTEKGYYDRFRGRVMFPICDSSGRVVAFTGRILVDDGKSAKYLNSPETALYNKSKILFGFDKAKNEIRVKDYSVIVEGQMDLIMSHQAGIINTVASSGTALTEDHLEILNRLSTNVVFSFDSDKAGENATKRTVAIALKKGMEVKVIAISGGKDPADMILQDPQSWSDALKQKQDVVTYLVERIVLSEKDEKKQKRRIESEVVPFILEMSSTMKQDIAIHTVVQISKGLVSEKVLWDTVNEGKVKKASEPSEAARVETPAKKEPLVRQNAIVRRLVGILFWQESKKPTDIDIDELKKSLEEIFGKEEVAKVLKNAESSRDELIFEAEAYHANAKDIKGDVAELLNDCEAEELKSKFAKVMAEIARSADSPEEKKKELAIHAQEIMERLKKNRRSTSP